MSRSSAGWISGLIGILIFSISLPATRVAVGAGGFDPLFLTAARAAIAGLVGGAVLVTVRAPLPGRADIVPLLAVAVGAVVGFPLLSAIALRHVTAGHATVFIGLLPLATAVFAVLRAGERPRPAFWAFAVTGSVVVALFALREGTTATGGGDALMLGAVIVCGLAYAEGARLSRRLGGWQVISWALVVSLPLMVPLAVATVPPLEPVGWPAWAGLAYVSLFSMFIGFVFWYRGLALGGIAAVGQLQLLQPFCGLVVSALLLGEIIAPSMIVAAAAVVLCVAGARWQARGAPSPVVPAGR